ncbi:hypothetical protein [Crateriforma conspicua]|uniref:Aldose 1-epimerase n=1 Tax=Crateriforma conspicua TaxID=2527996 RepID=A0A5C6FSW8_9PLAN|nr:hypothetical protein [Crateriforma conspicua]TWU64608.1 hypothetical protein V7x_01520 [Crateriforma conspicua]
MKDRARCRWRPIPQRFARHIFCVAWLLAFASAVCADTFDWQRYPTVVLTDGPVKARVYMPDQQRGINRGVRFDRSGFVGRVEYRGHRWFGPWHEMDDPSRNDNVMGTAGEFGMGTAGMPSPLGFNEAEEGQAFIKIGVGRVKKQGEHYRFGGAYEAIEEPPWKVKQESNRLEFRQELNHGGPWPYEYSKQIIVDDDIPGFRIEYELTNLGSHPIQQTYYAHNFISIDDQSIGPDCELKFGVPMNPEKDRPEVSFSDQMMTFLRPMPEGRSFLLQMSGGPFPVSANQVTVRNRQTGAGLRITGDASLERFHVWCTDRVICPEPFVKVHVAPGETFSWNDTYELLVAPSGENK